MTLEAVPAGWSRARYGDVLVETDDRAGQRTGLPVLSVTKTRGPMLASERFGKVMHGRDLSKYRVAPRHHVVADPMLLWDGSIGIQCVVEAGLVSPDYRVYKPTPAADASFLAHLVRSPLVLPHYQGGARGTNVRRNRIARTDFLSIPLVLPPLDEQKKIAVILASFDAAIEATQAVIDQLQVVKQAMMAELLMRGLPGRHTKVKMTEIGELPEEWQVAPLSSLVLFCDYGLSKALNPNSEGVAVLRMGNLADGRVLLHDLKYIDKVEVDERLFLAVGDVLFNRTNSKDLVGKVGVFGGSNRPVSFASYLLRLRPHPSRAVGEWLLAIMNLDANQAALRAMATPGVSQVNINRTKMLSLVVPVPPIHEQRDIIGALATVEARRVSEVEALGAMKSVKSAMLSVLLTGEVRVTPDEDAA